MMGQKKEKREPVQMTHRRVIINSKGYASLDCIPSFLFRFLDTLGKVTDLTLGISFYLGHHLAFATGLQQP